MRRKLKSVVLPTVGLAGLATDLVSNLLARYRFDGGLADSSGNGHTLVDGSETFGTGGGAVGDGWLLSSSPAAIDSLSIPFTSLTLAFWVFFGGGSAPQAATQALSESGGDTLQADCNRSTRVVTFTPITGAPAASPQLTASAWHHVCAACGGGVMTVYADGVAGNTGGGPPASTLTGWSVKALDPRAQIDDFRIYNRALSAAEVAALALGG